MFLATYLVFCLYAASEAIFCTRRTIKYVCVKNAVFLA